MDGGGGEVGDSGGGQVVVVIAAAGPLLVRRLELEIRLLRRSQRGADGGGFPTRWRGGSAHRNQRIAWRRGVIQPRGISRSRMSGAGTCRGASGGRSCRAGRPWLRSSARNSEKYLGVPVCAVCLFFT